jgi:hypothetical protein
LEKSGDENIYLYGFSSPSPTPEILSSVTNSPPNTIERVKRLETGVSSYIEILENKVQRHLKRSLDANSRLKYGILGDLVIRMYSSCINCKAWSMKWTESL